MPVITIRGQYGTWAAEIGELIAQKLNIDYVDREIIAGVAERLRRPSTSIEEKETPPSTLMGRLSEAMAQTAYLGDNIYAGIYSPLWEIPLNDTHYLSGLEYMIKELAGSKSIVIRGRGSQFILKDFPGAFHVLIVAPVEVRVKRIMEKLKICEEDARKEMARFDDGSREFVKRYFRADIADPINYDMVINTNHFSIEGAASIIVDAVHWLSD
ncbi:MAG: cytidylate kinase-like family protein [Syntrophaceae bacterium]|nr:cytidylate kinase-like family protein [Pseudomonadota bacterium]MCG2741819.1 cytidylate kinase-like family protein [Syntrophaceae bacterium]